MVVVAVLVPQLLSASIRIVLTPATKAMLLWIWPDIALKVKLVCWTLFTNNEMFCWLLTFCTKAEKTNEEASTVSSLELGLVIIMLGVLQVL